MKKHFFHFALFSSSHPAAVSTYLFEEVELGQVLGLRSPATAQRGQVARDAQPQEAQWDPHQHRLLQAQRQVRVCSV